jgi:hypothetical protein
VPSEEIFSKGDAVGFSRKTLLAAKKLAGFEVSNPGAFRGTWHWKIGADVARGEEN